MARRRPARAALAVSCVIVSWSLASCSSSNPGGVSTAATTATNAPVTTGTAPPATVAARPAFVPPSSTPPAPARTTRPVPNDVTFPSAANFPTLSDAIARGGPYVAANVSKMDAPTRFVASTVGLTYGQSDMATLRDAAVTSFQTDPPASALVLYSSFPLFRRMIWADSPLTPTDVSSIPTFDQFWRMEWVWATAYACGGPTFPADWSKQITAMLQQPDPDHYVTTHTAFGLATLVERGCTVDGFDTLRDTVVADLVKVIPSPFVVTDVSVEAMVGLQRLGRGDAIQPDWVTKTLQSQLPDGSFPGKAVKKAPPVGEWHTTLLAVWFLGAIRSPELSGPFFT